MNFFLDTEFIERGPEFPVSLISVGLVDQHGRTYYAELSDCDRSKANDWVKANVLPQLTGPIKAREVVANEIEKFVGYEPGEELRFWTYFGAYDWVLFAQLWGTMAELPKGFPWYTCDLKQYVDQLDANEGSFPEQPSNQHHALADAQWNRLLLHHLDALDPLGRYLR